jgi:hypothetical protein
MTIHLDEEILHVAPVRAVSDLVRVLSQPAYPSEQRPPAEVIQTLVALQGAFSGSHQILAG